MISNHHGICFELICAIVNHKKGSKALKIAKQEGVRSGTIMLGKGTSSSGILKFLELVDSRKEIVLMVAETAVVRKALGALNKEFNFAGANHGIIFTTKIAGFMGSHYNPIPDENENSGEERSMYDVINIIVEKGRAELVIDAALKVGARGGTIINARGSGIHETHKLFGMEIEPEKEIVMIVSERSQSLNIIESIRSDIDIDKPGSGIIFVQEISHVYGFAGGGL